MQYSVDTYYRFNAFAKNYIATGNLMMFCEEHQCHWIMDCIASYKPNLIGKDYLKVVTVTLNDKGGCTFKIETEIEGLLVEQDIPFTDLTEDVKIWMVDQGDDVVCMLPEDY